MNLEVFIATAIQQADTRLDGLKGEAARQVQEVRGALQDLANDAQKTFAAVDRETDPRLKVQLIQSAQLALTRRGEYIAAASLAFAETDARRAWETALDVTLKILAGAVKAL